MTNRHSALAGLVLVLLLPAALLAHQALTRSAPANGESVQEVPDTLRLTFAEPVQTDLTSIAVEGPEGFLVLGELVTAAGVPRVLLVPVEGGWHAGDFELRWRTVGLDGHPTDGTVAFTVPVYADGLPAPGERDEVGQPEDPADTLVSAHHDPQLFPDDQELGVASPGYAAVRALLFASLIAVLGAVALRLVVLPVVTQRRRGAADALRSGIDRGSARLGLGAAVVLLVATVARLWAQSASLFGTAGALDPGNLASTLSFQPWGTGWWLQLGAAVLALTGFALAARGARVGWPLAAAAAVLAAVTPGLSGHAVATPDMRWLSVPADALHVLAAGGWVGSLFALVLVGLPAAARLGAERRASAVSALVHGYSPTALIFAGILVATGVIAGWVHLGGISGLWASAYGRTLLLKVGIFSGVFVVGAYNFLRVRPALGDHAGARRLRRSSTIELVLAVAVIVVTAVLVATPPPAD